jgi:signal transduction histidine kinase
MGKRFLTIAGAGLLLLASTIPFLVRIDDPFEDSGLRALILELRGLDAALTSDVLQLRLGVEANYDSLARRQQEIKELAAVVGRNSADLGERASRRLSAVFVPFQAALAERKRVLEAFPIDNATLNNSLRLLGATYERARSRFEGEGQAASESLVRLDRVHRLTLQYYCYPDEALRASLQRELGEPWASDGSMTGAAQAMLGHARIVVAQKALVDDHVRRLVEDSGEKALLETFSIFEEEARASAERAVNLRAIVSSTCVLAVVLMCAAGVWAALRQSSALEREVRERIRADQEARKLEAELRQAQKLESIGQLAAGIAHEINTPVQFVSDSVHFVCDAVKDMARLIAEYQLLRDSVVTGAATPESAEAVSVAAEEADLPYLLDNVPKALARSLEGLDRVATIVRSLKEFAHPEQKEMAPADLNQAIQSTLTIARSEYKYVADVETDFGDLPQVTCHGGEVNQVVLNILVNAAHAIGDKVKGTENRGRIGIRTRIEGDHVVIAISDTGGGIPASVRERVFDPFFTTKEVGKGTGQGLAIARTVVVEKHGGTLTFETETGKGTTFFIRLPLEGRRQEKPLLEEAAA